MKNTRENLLKLLEKMNENVIALYERAREQGDEKYADIYLRESMRYEVVIDLMTDNKYFNEMAEIYLKENE